MKLRLSNLGLTRPPPAPQRLRTWRLSCEQRRRRWWPRKRRRRRRRRQRRRRRRQRRRRRRRRLRRLRQTTQWSATPTLGATRATSGVTTVGARAPIDRHSHPQHPQHPSPLPTPRLLMLWQRRRRTLLRGLLLRLLRLMKLLRRRRRMRLMGSPPRCSRCATFGCRR